MSTIKTTNITHGSNSGTANMVLASDGKVTIPEKKLVCPGTIIQVQSANKTDTATTASTSWTDTGLQVIITPTAASSKVFLMATFGSGLNTAGYTTHWKIDGTTTTSVGDAGGSAVQSGTATKNDHTYGVESNAFNFMDSPNSTSAITYKLQFKSTTALCNVYLNRPGNQDGNTSNTVANLTAMEIAQ